MVYVLYLGGVVVSPETSFHASAVLAARDDQRASQWQTSTLEADGRPASIDAASSPQYNPWWEDSISIFLLALFFHADGP